MKSGLGDRNNLLDGMSYGLRSPKVSMKSGLRDRNNEAYSQATPRPAKSLVRQRLRTATNKPQYKSWYFKMKDGNASQ